MDVLFWFFDFAHPAVKTQKDGPCSCCHQHKRGASPLLPRISGCFFLCTLLASCAQNKLIFLSLQCTEGTHAQERWQWQWGWWMGGCTEDIQVKYWSLPHFSPFPCPRQPAAHNVHPVMGHLPSLLPGDFLALAGEQRLRWEGRTRCGSSPEQWEVRKSSGTHGKRPG